MQQYPYSGLGSVVIVIPVYKERLTADEQYSVHAMQRNLSRYDVALVTPDTLRAIPIPTHQEKFPSGYFESSATYNQLLLSRAFYERFARFEYMLIYQLDALVFSDQLAFWCSQGYDFIGAPVNVQKNNRESPAFVGNGGFSLRKIATFLTTLTQHAPAKMQPQTFWKLLTHPPADVASLGGMTRVLKALSIARQMRSGIEGFVQQYSMNEDLFWSLRAPAFLPDYSLPSLDVAARFAVEANPRMWLARAGIELPFGCHAWAKWDRDFWEDHLL